MKILINYSANKTGVRDYEIIAENDQDEKHLKKIIDKMIEILEEFAEIEVVSK